MYTQEEIVKAYGPYVEGDINDPNYIKACLEEIENFPSQLKNFYQKLQSEQQSACYREGSWTFRQVINHLADSHMNAFMRFKLALTEDKPIIKPYIQNAWAATFDGAEGDAGLSVELIELLHKRWLILMRSMNIEDFKKSYIHPEYQKEYTLGYALGLYAWHGKHHLTQMSRYASNQGWI